VKERDYMSRLEESKRIVKGEKISRILEVVNLENKLVFKQSVENMRIALGFFVDLSNKTEEQILLAAAEHFVIRDLRKRHFENLSDSELLACQDEKFNMNLYEPTRVKKSDYDRARDSVLKLSREDFLKMMIEQYEMTEEEANELYNKKHS
jgi:hypothetical protein